MKNQFDVVLLQRKFSNFLLAFGPLVVAFGTAILTVPAVTAHPHALTIIGGAVSVVGALILWARKNGQSALDLTSGPLDPTAPKTE